MDREQVGQHDLNKLDRGTNCHATERSEPSNDNGLNGGLFDHSRHRLVPTKASFSQIRDLLSKSPTGANVAISTIWGTPSFTGIEARGAFRPDKGEFRGTGTDGNDRMPYVALWLASRDGCPPILLENESVAVDHSLVRWFQDAGLTSNFVSVTSASDLAGYLERRQLKLYSCDNYGPALDPYSLNSGRDFDLVSNKAMVKKLVGTFAPYEKTIDMFRDTVNEHLFSEVIGGGSRVFVKLCNDEHGGMGVTPVRSFEQFKSVLQELKAHTQRNQLSPELVLQRGVDGVSRSFSAFIVENMSEVPIVGLTDQIVDEATGRDQGNVHYPVTNSTTGHALEMIRTVVENVRAECPHAFGYLMCDFIETTESSERTVYAIDPGLRPSASTPSSMALLWLEEVRGEAPYVRNNLLFKFQPGFDYAQVREKLGDLTNPEYIFNEGRGVVPFSWEHLYGTGRLMAIAKNQEDYKELMEEVSRRSNGGLL